MTQQQRHLAYEGAAITVAGIFGVYVVPTLLSERDSMTVVAGGFLLLGWLAWTAWLLYRIMGASKNG
jgi:heme A synthase